MSKLIYIINISLDGYIEDPAGAIDWVDPAEIHDFITGLLRPIDTYLYGRRIYETMLYWDAPLETYAPERREFARVWQKAEKIVFSRTIARSTVRNSRVERDFDARAIRKLKQESAHDIAIAGAELARVALRAGLIDEFHLFVNPIVVGGGKPAFCLGVRANLELLSTRRFDTGVVHLHYRIRA